LYNKNKSHSNYQDLPLNPPSSILSPHYPTLLHTPPICRSSRNLKESGTFQNPESTFLNAPILSPTIPCPSSSHFLFLKVNLRWLVLLLIFLNIEFCLFLSLSFLSTLSSTSLTPPSLPVYASVLSSTLCHLKEMKESNIVDT